MISTMCCLLRRFIAPKMEYKIRLFLQPSFREVFHPPGLFKIGGVNISHRF